MSIRLLTAIGGVLRQLRRERTAENRLDVLEFAVGAGLVDVAKETRGNVNSVDLPSLTDLAPDREHSHRPW